MISDVINVAVVGMTFCRGVVSIEGTWRLMSFLGRHLAFAAFQVMLQMEAQNFLWSACHSS
jgi:hypothetical protein